MSSFLKLEQLANIPEKFITFEVSRYSKSIFYSAEQNSNMCDMLVISEKSKLFK